MSKEFLKLDLKSALIDGEVVIEDEAGVSSFVKLVSALKAGQSKSMVFYAFDLLYLDGMNLMDASLLDRKAALRALLTRRSGSIRFSEHFDLEGSAIVQTACEHGLEGIISKLKDRRYRSGRRDDWLKTKCIGTDEFVVGGYLDSTAQRHAVGALALGFFDRGRFRYAGRVGTGFNRRSAAELWKKLQGMRIDRSPFSEELTSAQRRGVAWIKPMLVVQIEYRAWTGDNLLRHPVYKGVREDKPAKEVRRPQARVSG